jgi:hypothetical protein
MAKKKEFPLAQVYGLLEPGPVVLVTTARAGRANIMDNERVDPKPAVETVGDCALSLAGLESPYDSRLHCVTPRQVGETKW